MCWGKGSQYAIDQIIDHIKSEGAICILGVSEYPVEINTRMILEKGLTLIGSSRSGSEDFQRTVELYKEHPIIIDYLATLIGQVYTITSVKETIEAFETDLSSSWGKTIMEWKI